MKSIFKASELELTRERKEHFLEKYGCDSKLSAACDILENGLSSNLNEPTGSMVVRRIKYRSTSSYFARKKGVF
ncbi:hypothetical protein EfmAA96_09170 [Enterococcus faecium]|nr:hypothetical protein EfmAA96_09170 [Enterococcus faecium]